VTANDFQDVPDRLAEPDLADGTSGVPRHQGGQVVPQPSATLESRGVVERE